eukprot:363682-Chlamydomonas_euryale.AAC.7
MHQNTSKKAGTGEEGGGRRGNLLCAAASPAVLPCAANAHAGNCMPERANGTCASHRQRNARPPLAARPTLSAKSAAPHAGTRRGNMRYGERDAGPHFAGEFAGQAGGNSRRARARGAVRLAPCAALAAVRDVSSLRG